MAVYKYHIFIHSSVDGHVGRFCVLALVNSAAVNIGMIVILIGNYCYYQDWLDIAARKSLTTVHYDIL